MVAYLSIILALASFVWKLHDLCTYGVISEAIVTACEGAM